MATTVKAVPIDKQSITKDMRDVFEVEGCVTIQGLVFRARASGDFLALLKKVNTDGTTAIVELPVTLGGLDAAGKLIVLGVKDGLSMLTSDDFKKHLASLVTLAKNIAEMVTPVVKSIVP